MKVIAQSSFEFLMIFMVGIVILTPVTLYIMSIQNTYSDNYKITSARNVVNKIVEAADSIYLQGPGSRIVLTLYFPNDITEAEVKDRMVSIKLSIKPGITEVYQLAKEPVSGSLPTTPGFHKIVVKNEGDHVSITS